MSRRPESYKPLTAGLFYPAEEEALRTLVVKHIPSSSTGQLTRLLYLPHADYSLTAPLLGRGFSEIQYEEPPFRVIVMARVHREMSFRISVPLRKYFETPLGSAFIDRWQVKQIAENFRGTVREDIPFEEEHCIELQLPFIKHLFPKARIVPLLVGSDTPETLELLKEVLAFLQKGDSRAPWIISGNLCEPCSPDRAQTQTEYFIKLAEAGEAEVLRRALDSAEISACGAGCLSASFEVLGPGTTGRLLKEKKVCWKDPVYGERTMGYGALGFFK